ncbi:unnamed protein product [Bemisia tabaci]|uniref:Gamma-secretase subunit Aph-1 n=2 Tax=Bemisia tabaci TaxID=7038 RepID=A0A9P0F2Y3_BEMTA|nr:unnamed protein product [Bemisia tabaci]
MPGTQMSSNKQALSYVAGLGFGLMSGAFSLVNILAEVIGPGTMGLHKGDPEDFCIISSTITMCFIFLHICWGIIFFEAIDRKNYAMFTYVLSTHLLVSYVTMLNASRLYWLSMSVILVVVSMSASVAFIISGGSVGSLKAIASKSSRPLTVQAD